MIEKLADIKTIYFDKTGTLTTGIMQVEDIEVVGSSSYEPKDLLSIAVSREASSNHILAESLRKFASKEGIVSRKAENIEETAGFRIKGSIDNKKYKLGRPLFLGINSNESDSTSMYISEDNNYIGKITFQIK